MPPLPSLPPLLLDLENRMRADKPAGDDWTLVHSARDRIEELEGRVTRLRVYVKAVEEGTGISLLEKWDQMKAEKAKLDPGDLEDPG